MDSSQRSVESYWRSRMIDAVTSDQDKVAPVYKLEEICQLLMSLHVSIVKEMSDFVLKRLDHKSPIVKHKALRLIKYAVGKSGVEFRREMQRHSVAVRQLFHYKGQPDPLKGDALNKAVRDTVQETINAIFSEESSKPAATAPTDDLNRRIQGFRNTNYKMLTKEKKSFISEVRQLIAMASRVAARIPMVSKMAARFGSGRMSSSGKILSEEEKAAENIYIKFYKKRKNLGQIDQLE